MDKVARSGKMQKITNNIKTHKKNGIKNNKITKTCRKNEVYFKDERSNEEKGNWSRFVGQLGKTVGEGALLKGLKGVFGFIKRFVGIFAALLLPRSCFIR